MSDLFGHTEFDTTPDASRLRSYNGGYMAAGRAAEEIILAWLEKVPWVLGVEDLRTLRVMREADVDCSISIVDGRITLGEIKSDRHLDRSGNFNFEILRINHTAPPDKAAVLGWSARSPARMFFFFAPSSNRIHTIAADEFRRALQGYTDEARRHTRLHYVETDAIKSTINVLVPARFVTAMPSYKAFDL